MSVVYFPNSLEDFLGFICSSHLKIMCGFINKIHLVSGGQTLGSATTFLGRNQMNLFRKFDVFEVIFASQWITARVKEEHRRLFAW